MAEISLEEKFYPRSVSMSGGSMYFKEWHLLRPLPTRAVSCYILEQVAVGESSGDAYNIRPVYGYGSSRPTPLDLLISR